MAPALYFCTSVPLFLEILEILVILVRAVLRTSLAPLFLNILTLGHSGSPEHHTGSYAVAAPRRMREVSEHD